MNAALHCPACGLPLTGCEDPACKDAHHLGFERDVGAGCPAGTDIPWADAVRLPLPPRAAELMSWDEIAADIDAGRDCLALVKARVMFEAGRGSDVAAMLPLSKLRDAMARFGLLPGGPTLDSAGNVRTVKPGRPTNAQLWERVHDGLLRELAEAGVPVDD